MRVAYGELLKTRGGEIGTAGFDLDVDWFGMQTRYLDLGFFRTRVRQYGVPLEREGNVLRGLSVSAIDIEVANGALHLGDFTISGAA